MIGGSQFRVQIRLGAEARRTFENWREARPDAPFPRFRLRIIANEPLNLDAQITRPRKKTHELFEHDYMVELEELGMKMGADPSSWRSKVPDVHWLGEF